MMWKEFRPIKNKEETPPTNGLLPDDFNLSELTPTKDHGGSSKIYHLGNTTVVKEKTNQHLVKDLESERLKLENNIGVCKKYLDQFILKTKFIIKDNSEGEPTIFIIQEKLPDGAVGMNPEGWNFVFDDEVRNKLKDLVCGIEKMYNETGLMIDLLAFSNIGFYQTGKAFYVYDFDPLICAPEKEQELSRTYNVSSIITNSSFKSYNNNRSSDAVLVNFEHLDLLKDLSTRNEE